MLINGYIKGLAVDEYSGNVYYYPTYRTIRFMSSGGGGGSSSSGKGSGSGGTSGASKKTTTPTVATSLGISPYQQAISRGANPQWAAATYLGGGSYGVGGKDILQYAVQDMSIGISNKQSPLSQPTVQPFKGGIWTNPKGSTPSQVGIATNIQSGNLGLSNFGKSLLSGFNNAVMVNKAGVSSIAKAESLSGAGVTAFKAPSASDVQGIAKSNVPFTLAGNDVASFYGFNVPSTKTSPSNVIKAPAGTDILGLGEVGQTKQPVATVAPSGIQLLGFQDPNVRSNLFTQGVSEQGMRTKVDAKAVADPMWAKAVEAVQQGKGDTVLALGDKGMPITAADIVALDTDISGYGSGYLTAMGKALFGSMGVGNYGAQSPNVGKGAFFGPTQLTGYSLAQVMGIAPAELSAASRIGRITTLQSVGFTPSAGINAGFAGRFGSQAYGITAEHGSPEWRNQLQNLYSQIKVYRDPLTNIVDPEISVARTFPLLTPAERKIVGTVTPWGQAVLGGDYGERITVPYLVQKARDIEAQGDVDLANAYLAQAEQEIANAYSYEGKGQDFAGWFASHVDPTMPIEYNQIWQPGTDIGTEPIGKGAEAKMGLPWSTPLGEAYGWGTPTGAGTFVAWQQAHGFPEAKQLMGSELTPNADRLKAMQNASKAINPLVTALTYTSPLFAIGRALGGKGIETKETTNVIQIPGNAVGVPSGPTLTGTKDVDFVKGKASAPGMNRTYQPGKGIYEGYVVWKAEDGNTYYVNPTSKDMFKNGIDEKNYIGSIKGNISGSGWGVCKGDVCVADRNLNTEANAYADQFGDARKPVIPVTTVPATTKENIPAGGMYPLDTQPSAMPSAGLIMIRTATDWKNQKKPGVDVYDRNSKEITETGFTKGENYIIANYPYDNKAGHTVYPGINYVSTQAEYNKVMSGTGTKIVVFGKKDCPGCIGATARAAALADQDRNLSVIYADIGGELSYLLPSGYGGPTGQVTPTVIIYDATGKQSTFYGLNDASGYAGTKPTKGFNYNNIPVLTVPQSYVPAGGGSRITFNAGQTPTLMNIAPPTNPLVSFWRNITFWNEEKGDTFGGVVKDYLGKTAIGQVVQGNQGQMLTNFAYEPIKNAVMNTVPGRLVSGESWKDAFSGMPSQASLKATYEAEKNLSPQSLWQQISGTNEKTVGYNTETNTYYPLVIAGTAPLITPVGGFGVLEGIFGNLGKGGKAAEAVGGVAKTAPTVAKVVTQGSPWIQKLTGFALTTTPGKIGLGLLGTTTGLGLIGGIGASVTTYQEGNKINTEINDNNKAVDALNAESENLDKIYTPLLVDKGDYRKQYEADMFSSEMPASQIAVNLNKLDANLANIKEDKIFTGDEFQFKAYQSSISDINKRATELDAKSKDLQAKADAFKEKQPNLKWWEPMVLGYGIYRMAQEYPKGGWSPWEMMSIGGAAGSELLMAAPILNAAAIAGRGGSVALEEAALATARAAARTPEEAAAITSARVSVPVGNRIGNVALSGLVRGPYETVAAIPSIFVSAPGRISARGFFTGLGESIAYPFTHPVETAKGIGALATGQVSLPRGWLIGPVASEIFYPITTLRGGVAGEEGVSTILRLGSRALVGKSPTGRWFSGTPTEAEWGVSPSQLKPVSMEGTEVTKPFNAPSPLEARIFEKAIKPQLPAEVVNFYESEMSKLAGFTKGKLPAMPGVNRTPGTANVIGTETLSSEDIQATWKLLNTFRGSKPFGSATMGPQLTSDIQGQITGPYHDVDFTGSPNAPFTQKEMEYITQEVSTLWRSRGLNAGLDPKDSTKIIDVLTGEKMFEIHSGAPVGGKYGYPGIFGKTISRPEVTLNLPSGGKVRVASLSETMLGKAEQFLGYDASVNAFNAAERRGVKDLNAWVEGVYTKFGPNAALGTQEAYINQMRVPSGPRLSPQPVPAPAPVPTPSPIASPTPMGSPLGIFGYNSPILSGTIGVVSPAPLSNLAASRRASMFSSAQGTSALSSSQRQSLSSPEKYSASSVSSSPAVTTGSPSLLTSASPYGSPLSYFSSMFGSLSSPARSPYSSPLSTPSSPPSSPVSYPSYYPSAFPGYTIVPPVLPPPVGAADMGSGSGGGGGIGALLRGEKWIIPPGILHLPNPLGTKRKKIPLWGEKKIKYGAKQASPGVSELRA